MKRLPIFLAPVLTLLLLFSCFPFAVVAVPAEEGKLVRVGVFDFDGFYGEDDGGAPLGYGYAYLEEIALYTGYRYEFVYGSWAECLTRLEKGDIDLLDFAQLTPERQEQFLFSAYATGKSFAMLTVQEDRKDITYGDTKAFAGQRIGILRENICNESFATYAKEQGFTYQTVAFDSVKDLEVALQTGQVDAILTGSLRKLGKEKVVSRIAPTSFYLMANQARKDLIQEIDTTLEELQHYRPNMQEELENRYFPQEQNTVSLTRKELDYLEKKRRLTVVYDSFWPPFESYDAQRREAVGLNVELFHSIADDMGLSFDFIHEKNYEKALELVVSGQADMLLSYDTNPQKATELNILLSETFLESPIAIIGRNYDLTASSVFAISEMHPLIYEYISRRFPNSEIRCYASIEDCYRAIERGHADFTAENIYAAIRAIKSENWGTLMITGLTTLNDRFSFAFSSQTDRTLLNIFNKYIAALSEEKKETLLLSYSANVTAVPGIEMLLKRYSTQILTGATLLLVVLASYLFKVVEQQKETRRRLWEIAYRDELTGLPNVNQFRGDLERILTEKPQDQHLVIQMDINKFNLINELYGFEEGDRVLCAVRDALLASVSEASDVVARINGDHFLALFSYRQGEDVARLYRKAEGKFRHTLNGLCDHRLHFTVGRYLIPIGESNANSILEKANYAHNVAKRSGLLNLYYDYDDSLKQQAIRHRDIENKMESALAKGNFVVFLQPKYRIRDHALTGAEALVRWLDFNPGEMLSPMEFIPLFEKNGFVLSLDFYMFRCVCQMLKDWERSGRPMLTISVNFSRLHLNNPYFVDKLEEIANELDAPRSYLEIELTESAVEENPKDLEQLIIRLHQAGFAFAMDDFGTGYSSLGLLKNLSVDTLKIDRSFFEDTGTIPRAKVVVENVIRMSKELGIHTVAEGVESREHLDFLNSIGCEVAQGYFFAKPLSEEEFALLQPTHEAKVTESENLPMKVIHP